MDEAIRSERWEPEPMGFVELVSAAEPILEARHAEHAAPELDEDTLVELVDLAVRSAPQRLLSRFREIAREDGLALDDMLFDRVRPVANRLGECWLDDSLSFGEVTVGAEALQRVIAAFGYDAEGPLQHRELVVLTAAPGEQHVLPIHLLSEAIRADGWATHVDAQLDLEDLLDLVSVEEVAMIGITSKDPERLAALDGWAEALHEASIAPLTLAVGGSPDLEDVAQVVGFTYFSSGRAFCRRLAPGGGL